MKIHFKNGITKQVPLQVAETIKQRIIEGCRNFQIFSDENNELLLVINLTEIVLID